MISFCKRSIRLHAALPKRLGTLAFWRSDKDFIVEMERIYKNASSHAESYITSSEDTGNWFLRK
jgi:uncharacterized Zn finger protein